MKNDPKVVVLDCTLRDGGYYNSWDFEAEVVENYLCAMAAAQIDYVELGLRQFKNEAFLGAHAYTTREFLDRLNLPSGPVYGVMVDAKTVLSNPGTQEENIDKLFLDAKDEKIGLIRIAAHHSEVLECRPMAERLKQKGYEVGLNIMQISACSDKKMQEFGRILEQWECIDVLYFADSLGSMLPKDVAQVYQNIRRFWSGNIGFHSHNNLGQGIANVIQAIDSGCAWVDATVTGMGRGAGNAQTEYLLLELNQQNDNRDPRKVFELVSDVFEPMRENFKWGPSLDYYVAAIKSVHPTYVQRINADKSIPPSHCVDLVEDISKFPNPGKFSESTLAKVKSRILQPEETVLGDTIPKFLAGKEVVLVAQTETSLKYILPVTDYIRKKSPVVMSINYPKLTTGINFDYVVVSHNERFRLDRDRYSDDKLKFIAPKKLFSDGEIDIVHDYGISVRENIFQNEGNFALIPSRLTLAYAVSFCLDAGVKSISLVGVSGIGMDDTRHKEMQQFLSIVSQKGFELASLTPTSFAIKEKSIFAI